MKNILFILAFFCLGVSNVFSQSQKNDLKLTISALPLFGSSGNFSGVNGFVVKPSVGFFISDKTSIDLNFSYATLNKLKISNVDSYYNSYAFIPALRNNFINEKKIRIFAEFGFGLGTIDYSANNKNFNSALHQDLSGGISILNLGVGINYFINEHFGVEIIIPYLRTTNITSNTIHTIYSGVGPTLGLTYKLNNSNPKTINNKKL